MRDLPCGGILHTDVAFGDMQTGGRLGDIPIGPYAALYSKSI